MRVSGDGIKGWQLLYIIQITELWLLGSGQMTLRMLLFLISLIVALFLFLTGKTMQTSLFGYIISYLCLIVFSSAVGAFNLADNSDIFEDIKPLSFFFAIFFIFLAVNCEAMVDVTVRVFDFCAKTLIISYLLYLIVCNVFVLNFEYIYINMHFSGDFMFRGEGYAFFYKGFCFLPIAAALYLIRKNRVWLILALIAIFFTYTRGFYVITMVAFITYYLTKKNPPIRKMLLLIIISIVLYTVSSSLDLFDVSEDRVGGDKLRIITIHQVYNNITSWSALFGHGFGIGVPIRPIHMEMSFLEIFHKQGIIGLAFWIILLVDIIKTCKSRIYDYRCIFFMISTIMIYVQSLFNPYITNPIGMTMVLVCFVCCKRIAPRIENTLCNSTI